MNSNYFCFNTQEQEESFKELKSRIELAYGTKEANDFQVYRFLKARNFVVKAAEDMMIKHFEWKKSYGIDTILDDYKLSEVLEKYFQPNIIGYDQESHPTIYVKLGAADFKGILRSITKFEYIKYIAYFLLHCEKLLKELSQKAGKPIQTWNCIMDVKNFPTSQAIHKPVIEFLMEAFCIYEGNFPERLERTLVINVSAPFFIAYNIIKPILSGETLRKVKLFGTDGWKEEVAAVADPDDLPAFLGGNKTDPDGNPLCLTTVNHCGIVPEYYYFKNAGRRLSMQEDVVTYELSRKGKADIVFDVVEPGSHIEWEFASDHNDIAFRLSYKAKHESKIKPISLIETQRVEAHMHSEIGMYVCSKTGVYILTLDNSYSWFQRKKIFCRTSLVLPNN